LENNVTEVYIEHRGTIDIMKMIWITVYNFMDEVTGGWRKLHSEELHGLYSSLSIVRVIKARRMRWAAHVARMGEVRGACSILVGRPEGRNH
jgi:hypothetical protein